MSDEMVLKTVKIRKDMYDALVRISGKGESFDKVIRGLAIQCGVKITPYQKMSRRVYGFAPLKLEILRAIDRMCGVAKPREVIEEIRKSGLVSEREMRTRLNNGQLAWKSKVYTYVNQMKAAGLLVRDTNEIGKGIWMLTDRGKRRLEEREALEAVEEERRGVEA